ncbi:MAG TPA: hypothetical protein VHB72_00150 [Candidatus Saccharimonadales bacterium]|nr:hypothetical protein [Candidatus Saccharimonadales bacterium]
MRKFGVGVCVLILFLSLLILAFSTSSNIAFTHPSKVEKWLNDSNLYGAFVENAIDQAERTAGTDQSGGISLSDTAVRQAAESAFSAQVLRTDVNAVIDSNYAWLQGKSSTPNFKVNLTDAKESFAQQVGNYVKTYLGGLPVCSSTQLAQLNPQTTDPLTLQCRPPTVDPATEGAEVTQQIANSTQFLSSPVVTAENINPNGDIQNNGQPYYERFSSLPKMYQLSTILPWISGVIVLLSAAGVLFLAAWKRSAAKIIAVVLTAAGIIMLLLKFASDAAFHQAENHIFNSSAIGQLQKALTTFFHLAENQLVKVDMWFGIAYLILALVLVAILLISRPRKMRPILARLGNMRTNSTASGTDKTPAATNPETDRAPETKPSTPKRPKPPRLIQ